MEDKIHSARSMQNVFMSLSEVDIHLVWLAQSAKKKAKKLWSRKIIGKWINNESLIAALKETKKSCSVWGGALYVCFCHVMCPFEQSNQQSYTTNIDIFEDCLIKHAWLRRHTMEYTMVRLRREEISFLKVVAPPPGPDWAPQRFYMTQHPF